MKAPTIVRVLSDNDKTGHKDTPIGIAAEAIRERSGAAELISESEILGILKDGHLFPAEKQDKDVAAILAQSVRENEDIHKFTVAGSGYYYSSRYMTEAYAEILRYKLEGPLRLIAETVRENSCKYQRPIPLDIFTKSPFDLSHDQVLDYLKTMAGTTGYEDIVTAGTSASGIYLYSSSHLETAYAEMLAEWLDVGQSENS